MFKNFLITISILLVSTLIAKHAFAMGTKPIPPNSLEELSTNYGLPKYIQKNNNLFIKGAKNSLVFHIGSRRLLFNNTLIMMNEPLTAVNKEAFLSPIDITDTLAPLLAPKKLLQLHPIKTVILDPGHGGSDPGARGKSGLKEKDVVFDIAKRCQKKLQVMGINAVMTRKKNKFITLKNRPKIATKLNADLFISIHVNSAGNSAASGIETHILPAVGSPCTAPSKSSKNVYPGHKNNKMSVLLAYYVHQATLNATKTVDRGVRRSRFSVLRNAPCPAILIECGFLSNKSEEKKLNSPLYRGKIATAIAESIEKLVNN